MTPVLDVLAYVLLAGSLVGVIACANWPRIQGWLALLDDCAESVVDAWGFGDWSDDAQGEPYNWAKDLTALGRPVEPANRDRRQA